MSNQLILSTYGQIVIGDSTDTRFGFVYSNEEITDNSWNTTFFDPRIARTFGSSRIYALWSNEEGYYYSLIDKNPEDERNGFIMVTIFSRKSKINNGKAIVESLVALWRTIINEKNNDPQILNAILNPLVQYQQRSYNISRATSTGKKGYRVYSQESELYKIMQLPDQSEYSEVDRVLVVNESTVRPEIETKQDYVKMQSRIVEYYYVRRTTDYNVITDKSRIESGDILTITYKKDNCLDQYAQVKIDGSPSANIEYQGHDIIIKSPLAIGIKFYKKMVFNSYCNGQLVRHKLTIDDCSVDKQIGPDGNLYLLDGVKEVQLSFSSDVYEPLKIVLNQTDLLSMTKNLELVEKSKDVFVYYLAPNGMRKRGLVSVKMSDPVYSVLLEMCNNGDPVNKKEKEIPAKPKETGHKGDQKGEDKKTPKFKKYKLISLSVAKYAGIVIAGIMLLFIGYSVVMLCFDDNYDPFALFNSKPEAQPEVVDAPEAEVEQNKAIADSTSIQKEQVDIEINEDSLIILDQSYLKYAKDDKWSGDSLQSKKYQDFFEMLKSLDIDRLLVDEYRNLPNEVKNGYWTNLIPNIETLKKKPAYETEIKEQITQAMKDCYSEYSNMFDLKKFSADVSFIKSKYNPNTGNGGASSTTQKPNNAAKTNLKKQSGERPHS